MELIILSVAIFAFVAYSLWPQPRFKRDPAQVGSNLQDPSVSNSSLDAFFIANRDLTTFPTFTSILATKIGGGFLITFSIYFVKSGLPALAFSISAAIGYLIFARLSPHLRQLSEEKNWRGLGDLFRSKEDYLANKFLQLTANSLIILSLIAWVLTNTIVGGEIIAASVEVISIPSGNGTQTISISALSASLLILGTAGFYIFAKGYQAVVRSDSLQVLFFLLLLVVGIIAVWMPSRGGAGVDLDPSFTDSLTFAELMQWAIFGLLFPFGSYDLYERIFSSKENQDFSENTFKKSLYLTSVLFVAVSLLLAVFLYKILAKGYAGASEDILFAGVREVMNSPGLAVLWSVALLCIAISSLDTFLFGLGKALLFSKYDISVFRHRFLWILIGVFVLVVALNQYDKVVERITLFGVVVSVVLGVIMVVLIGLNSQRNRKTVETGS